MKNKLAELCAKMPRIETGQPRAAITGRAWVFGITFSLVIWGGLVVAILAFVGGW